MLDWKHTGRALRHRNFRLFFFGQGMSLVGTWMQQVAMGWLVYRLTGSPMMLGLVAFAGQVPIFLLSPIAGVVIDKRSRHRTLFLTQGLSMAQALVLAALVLTGHVTVPWLLCLALFIGTVNAFDIPARQSFIVEMIEHRDDLPNALALHSTVFNGARLIGPTIAGLLIVAAGEGTCFLVNALSYFPILLALGSMKFVKKKPAAHREGSVWKGVLEGFRYAAGLSPIRFGLTLLAVVSVTGGAYPVLLPIVAREVLGGGPHTLGFLVGASGCGALAAALYLAQRKSLGGLVPIITSAILCFGSCLVLFSFSRSFVLSLFLIAGAGFGLMTQMVATNTMIQTLVEDDKRGRVMSLYVMSLIGMSPFGSLLAGTLAGLLGAPRAILIGGTLCLLSPLLFARRLAAIAADAGAEHAKNQITVDNSGANG